MKFASGEVQAQLPQSHPDLCSLARDFDVWSTQAFIPEPFIVELWRTRQEQGDIYVQVWRDIQRRLKAGQPVINLQGFKPEYVDLDDGELRERAEEKFSWHLVRCAADFRTKHYSVPQLTRVIGFFKQRCSSPLWELVFEPHGTSMHIHAAKRDFRWRTRFTEDDDAPKVA